MASFININLADGLRDATKMGGNARKMGTLPQFAHIVAKKYAEFVSVRQEDSQRAYPVSSPVDIELFAEEVVYQLVRYITQDHTYLPANDPVKAIATKLAKVDGVPTEGPVRADKMTQYAEYFSIFKSGYGCQNWEGIVGYVLASFNVARVEDADDCSAYKILKENLGWDCYTFTEQEFTVTGRVEATIRQAVQDKFKARWWAEGDSPQLKSAAVLDLLDVADIMLLLTPSYVQTYKTF